MVRILAAVSVSAAQMGIVVQYANAKIAIVNGMIVIAKAAFNVKTLIAVTAVAVTATAVTAVAVTAVAVIALTDFLIELFINYVKSKE
jgi:hypothetical protein